jgi:hypothetical protein
MNKSNIVIGRRYKITGTSGGCTGRNRCGTCTSFPEHEIIVTGFNDRKETERCVEGRNPINSHHNCSFNPADLSPITHTMKELLE